MTRDEIITALEMATGPSMGLSREVARFVGWVNRGNSRNGEWFHPSDTRHGKPVLDSLRGTDVYRDPPNFTGSLDAALTLVGNHWWEVRGRGPYYACVGHEDGTGRSLSDGQATPPLALCIAALRAREPKP